MAIAGLLTESAILKDVLESFPFGVIVLDATGKIQMLNRKQEESSRIRREKVIGLKFHETWLRLFKEHDFSETYWNLLNKRQPFHYSLQNVSAQFYDEKHSGILSGFPLSSGNGFILLSELTKADKKNKNNLERLAGKLEELSSFLKNLLDFSPNAVIRTDSKGVINYINSTGEEIFKCKKQETVGSSISHLLCDPSIIDKVESGKVFDFGINVECQKKGGKKFAARMQFRTLNKKAGKEKAWIFIFNDISLHEKMELSLKEQLRFERFISDLSASFINMVPDDFDQQITDGLRNITEFLEIERSFLLIIDENTKSLQMMHGWAIKGEELPFSELARDLYPWNCDSIINGDSIIINRLEELPKSALIDKENLIRYNVKSYLCIPLKVGGIVIGALSLNTIHKEFHWPEELIKRMTLIGEIFSNCLARKQSDLQLRTAFLEIEQLKNQMEADYTVLREEIESEKGFHEIIGQSAPLKHALFKINQVASTDTTVMIFGETGTGKELVARALHNLSQRKKRPLVKVNCASLSPNLIESELFGHEKGAFTGAHARKLGRFEIADGTTLFLDEIGELPLEVQAKLLGVLQDNEFERMGSTTVRKVDARLIAATNRNLEDEVRKGRFRQDLLYRLNVFPITVPPLRQRREDIPLLVNLFVNRFCKKLGRTITNIPKSVITDLQQHHWPGNIRELENTIERAVVSTKGTTLLLVDRFETPDKEHPEERPIKSLSNIERDHIIQALKSTNWRISGKKGAALLLDLHPNTLRYRMAKLNINRNS